MIWKNTIKRSKLKSRNFCSKKFSFENFELAKSLLSRENKLKKCKYVKMHRPPLNSITNKIENLDFKISIVEELCFESLNCVVFWRYRLLFTIDIAYQIVLIQIWIYTNYTVLIFQLNLKEEDLTRKYIPFGRLIQTTVECLIKSDRIIHSRLIFNY